jgi:hypothetical protein
MSIYKPKLRIYSSPSAPLFSGEDYQIGFYDAGVMRQVSETFGINYKIWSLPLPSDTRELNTLISYLNNPKVIYSLLDKDKVVFATTDSPNSGWMDYINKLGYQVHAGPKTGKRLKSFHRPTLLNANFDHLNILYVDAEDYSRYDYDHDVASYFRDPAVRSRLADGGFIISSRIIQSAVQNLPVFTPKNDLDDKEYFYDFNVRQKLIKDLLNQKVYNARLIFQDGFLKGNCFTSDLLPEGVDVITVKDNVKSEITYSRGFRFLAEPQSAKNKVATDDQTVINLPHLFPKTEMRNWLKEEHTKMFNKLVENKILGNWRSIYQRNFRNNNTKSYNEEEISDQESSSRAIYSAYQWIASGNKLTDSPWLFETIGISHARRLEKRIPIPCAVYEQIIPECMASMAGYDYVIEEGTIIKSHDLNVHVVNDLDWLEMYASHGGHDADDFFKIFYRTMNGGEYDGEKVVIAARSPNGIGEYTIFKYVEGQWFPTWEKSNGQLVSFPLVNGKRWPVRLSEAIANNKVKYTGFPSASLPKPKFSGQYTVNDVINDVKIAMAGGSVGGFVNATMAHSMVIGKHRPVQLCSLEDAIDKCIIPDSKLDVKAIDEESYEIMKEVHLSGKPFDPHFYAQRGLRRFFPPSYEPKFKDGKISDIANLTSQQYAIYCNKIRRHAQNNIKPSSTLTLLAQRLRYQAWPVLRYWRMNLYNVNSSEQVQYGNGKIDRNSWDHIYSSVIEKIHSYERIEDRHDFMIALHYVCFTNPTSSGKITDQIVMNRFVFPYLMDAMFFYGLAAKPIFMDNSGNKIRLYRNTNWFCYDENGQLQSFSDPHSFQQAHSKFSSER